MIQLSSIKEMMSSKKMLQNSNRDVCYLEMRATAGLIVSPLLMS